MRPGGARRAPVRVPAVVGQGQALPVANLDRWRCLECHEACTPGADLCDACEAEVEHAMARRRARDRAAGAIDTAGDFVRRTRKPGDRS